LIGSIRRECLDHIVVFSERHLRHVLLSYMNYCMALQLLNIDSIMPTPKVRSSQFFFGRHGSVSR
jgi:hypothetical protein